MPRSVSRWTQKQKEVAVLVNQGMSVTEIVGKGYSRPIVQRVKRALAKPEQPNPLPTPEKPPEPSPSTKVRVRTLDPVEVGALQIIPEDWRINQYGAFLILDTYNQSKRIVDYGGTVGEFLCDVCQAFRQLLKLELLPFLYLQEGDNDAGEKTSQGGGVDQAGGEAADGADTEFAE